MVLLASSGKQGIAYVETKNLDGETNLKTKVADKAVNKAILMRNDQQAAGPGSLQEEQPLNGQN